MQESAAPPAPPTPRPPWVVWAGLAVVLAAAAVLSFDALRSLAIAVGIPNYLAWLLPVAVDAGAAVSCATWLGGRTTRTAARFAGRMTWALLAVTVAGNAAQLGMHAHGITPPWWVAVLVGSIPPAVVGSVVHLVVLLVRATDRSVEVDAHLVVDVERAQAAAGVPVVAMTPTRPCYLYRLFGEDDALLYVGIAWDVADRFRKHRERKEWWPEAVEATVTTYPTRYDALAAELIAIDEEKPRYNRLPGSTHDAVCDVRREPDGRYTREPTDDWTPADPIEVTRRTPVDELTPARRTPAIARGQAAGVDEDDQTLIARLTAWADREGSVPSRERVRVEFGIGTRRAARIRDAVLQPSDLEVA